MRAKQRQSRETERARAGTNDTVEPLDEAMPEAELRFNFSFISASMFLKTQMWNLILTGMRGKIV